MTTIRVLTIRGQIWRWSFGHRETIVWGPDGKKNVLNMRSLGYGSEDTYPMKPSDVVKIINFNILGYDPAKGFPGDKNEYQPDLRDGYEQYQGPRGLWQYRICGHVTYMVTPEDVSFQVETHRLSGMSANEWVDKIHAGIQAIKEIDPHYFGNPSDYAQIRTDQFFKKLREFSHPLFPKIRGRTVRQFIRSEYNGEVIHA